MEHLSQQAISDFRERKLSPHQLLAVDQHLADCEDCHRLVAQDREGSISELYNDLISSDRSVDDHLTYEAIESLVDNKATDVDREIANLHLSSCSQCTSDLEALSELREQRPVIVHDRTTASSFFNLSWPKLAFAALAILVVAGLSWIVWRSQRSSVATNQVASSATPSPVTVSSPIPSPSVLPSPEIVVSLNDSGGLVTLDKNGKLEGLGDLPGGLSNAVRKALTSGQVEIDPTLAGLKGKSGTLMGVSSEGTPFRLVSPVGIVVETDRPTFKWNAYNGATTYVVKVLDSDFNQVASSLSQTATSWQIPIPLRRGNTYTWQVTANKEGEEVKSPVAPAAQIRFGVLAQDRLSEINRVRTTKPPSHLVLGIMYAQVGLLEEARSEFGILLRNNPESKVAPKFLQEVTRKQ